MKGDFSRLTYKPGKAFNRVLEQQGRVRSDADVNELVEILVQAARAQGVDVIGRSAVPKNDAAFRVISASHDADGRDDLRLSGGRLYVDGIMVELVENTSYQSQPQLPTKEDLDPAEGRTDLVFLDVWERHITAIEDPELLEVALGGPDTTTRTSVVWQVGVKKDVGKVTCADAIAGYLPGASDARLSTQADEPPAVITPCSLPTEAGYRGLENRLYRVEIHDGSDPARPTRGKPIRTGRLPTFKWSRDNGAVTFAVEEILNAGQVRIKKLGKDQVLALRKDDWVELSDDDSELDGKPGTLAQITAEIDPSQRIVTLGKPTAGFSAAKHAKLRRWDQNGDAIPVQIDQWLTLEDGIKIKFAGNRFSVGDYWVFAARTAGAWLEPLDSAPAMGIRHHYVPLALVTWTRRPPHRLPGPGPHSSWHVSVQYCPATFPPLSEITAEDVSYDNTTCRLPAASTVQDALDALCKARDLRFHNRHLHGSGVVCGLQVVCGPDPAGEQRRHVTTRPGYAIDSKGDDLILERALTVDLLDEIAQFEKATPAQPILTNGEGRVSLCLGRDDSGALKINVEPYDPRWDTFKQHFDGTLLAEFLRECIQEPLESLTLGVEGALNKRFGTTGVSQRERLLTSLAHLLWQYFDPVHGRNVFLSPGEHSVLETLYSQVKEHLKSGTFCALLANARPLPEYPFGDHRMSAVFAKASATRLRVHPNGGLGYAVGRDNRIDVYDLRSENLLAQLEFPGDPGLLVRDVALSPDGKRLFAVATLRRGDVPETHFAVAEVGRWPSPRGRSKSVPVEGVEKRHLGTHTWTKSVPIRGVEMVTLATVGHPELSNLVWAVGLGKGLYRIDPETLSSDIAPVRPFAAGPHLVLKAVNYVVNRRKVEAVVAVASDTQGDSLGGYSKLLLELLRPGTGHDIELELVDPVNHGKVSGRDNIAVASVGTEFHIVAVVGGDDNRQLLVWTFEPSSLKGPSINFESWIVDLPEERAVRIAHLPESPCLLVCCEETHRLKIVDLTKRQLVGSYVLPLQVLPHSLALGHEVRGSRMLYALNLLSISVVPEEHLKHHQKQTTPPEPGTPEYLRALEEYRRAMIEAFLDLAVAALQHLKDCFCQRLLVDCPVPEVGDKVYLAHVSVQASKVHQICNLSMRKYVKTFPTVEHWLSLVPLLPLTEWAFERFCCWAVPEFLRRVVAPEAVGGTPRLRANEVRQGLDRLRRVDLFKGRTAQLANLRGLANDWLLSSFTKPLGRLIAQERIVGQSLEEAEDSLRTIGVTVAGIESYDPSGGIRNLRAAMLAPVDLKEGTRVRLVEQDGVVRYCISAEPELSSAQQLQSELVLLRDEMAKLQAESREALRQRDREIVDLRDSLVTMKGGITRLDALETQVAQLRKTRRPKIPP